MVPDPLDSLLAAGRTLAARGWTPATSGNLSVRAPEGFHVTASGLDKGALTRDDLLRVDGDGRPVEGTRRPSAETLLHAQIYAWDAEVGAVLHVHTQAATVLSRAVTGDVVVFEGYELCKAFAGVTTHELPVAVPIVENSQDVPEIARRVGPRLGGPAPGYLIRGHGLYAWGATVADALRHVEAFDFLFGCELEHRRIRS